jgi:hypothetical protein
VNVVGFPAANGHSIWVGLTDKSDNLLAASNGGPGSVFADGKTPGIHLYKVSNPSVEYATKSDTTYDLSVWVDMNDNASTIAQPEAGIDYIYQPWLKELPTTKGEISVGMTSADFILAQ